MADQFLLPGKRGTMTTLQAPGKPIGAASLTLASPINWPTERDVIFALRKVNLADGKEVENSYSEWRGKLTGNTIDGLTLLQGNDQDYPAGDTTQAYITISTSMWEALIEGLDKSHNPDGSLKEDIVKSENIAPGAVTTDTLGESVVEEKNINFATIPYFNRAWSTVSKVNNTVYTNTNDYPIDISIILSRTTKFSIVAMLRIDTVIRQRITANDSDNGTVYDTFNATIPAGSSYQLQITVGTVDLWSELS